MMVASAMADAIRSGMGFPLPVSTQLQGWAAGVIAAIQAGQVNNAAGTITGTCPPGGPLTLGTGANGVISGISASSMASQVVSGAGYPFTSSELSTFCTQIVQHIETSGVVVFTSGNVTGVCTNSIVSSGSLTAGTGMNGQITSLSGSTLASLIHSAVGYPGSVSGPLTQFCTAMVDYIMDNAVVSYTSGNVTGSCPAGGGALSGGTGINGTIA